LDNTSETSIFTATILRKKIFRIDMKPGIHPEYKPVVFQDTSCDFAILTRSTIRTTETIKWTDGNTYPLVKLEISSGSHPFFTGKQKLLDTAGRVEKFNKKYSKKQ
jgi:large subunit ribosomal protein L31